MTLHVARNADWRSFCSGFSSFNAINREKAQVRRHPGLKTSIAHLNRFSDIKTVSLLVGPEKTEFIVHKKIICDASPFFYKAFNSGFREGRKQSMNLPEEGPELVDCLTQWLYAPDFQKVRENLPVDTNVHTGEVDFYLLAEKFGIKKLKDQIIDHLVQYTNDTSVNPADKRFISFAKMAEIYNHTTPKDGLRKLVLQWYKKHIDLKCYDDEGVQQWLCTEPELARDLILTYTQRNREQEAQNPPKLTPKD